MAVLIYFFATHLQSTQSKGDAKEVQQVVKAVSTIMELPQNETPTLATVVDITKLVNQTFFKNAKNGDKVLIYTQTQKAIIYRPSIKKIIEVGPVRMDNRTLPTPTSALIRRSITPSLRPSTTSNTVSLYNGTSTEGLTYKIEAQLLSAIKDIHIVNRATAGSLTYEKTIIIDLTTKNRLKAQEIANALNAQISTLPQGETLPNADILIIIGKDKK